MNIKKLIGLICFVIALSISSVMAQSARQAFYPVMGIVTAFNDNKIVVSDQAIFVLPTLKVRLKNKSLGELSDVKIGQFVGMELVTINGRRLVDTIHILPNRN